MPFLFGQERAQVPEIMLVQLVSIFPEFSPLGYPVIIVGIFEGEGFFLNDRRGLLDGFAQHLINIPAFLQSAVDFNNKGFGSFPFFVGGTTREGNAFANFGFFLNALDLIDYIEVS